MDKYINYNKLSRYEKEGIDYEIQVKKTGSKSAVIAPHGGGIEPGTIDIAEGVAGNEHNFYSFKGIKKRGNTDLHITSNRFDEPVAMELVNDSDRILSVHGHHGEKDIVYVGGRDSCLKTKIINELTSSGFNAEESLILGLRGYNPSNICNRGRTGMGVQLEISAGLRKKMFADLTGKTERKKTMLFYTFVGALKKALGKP